MTTVATAVGQALADCGVRHCFGVVGNGNIVATAALVAGGVRYVAARHEGGAVTMADAYHRTTGEVAVCSVTYGPGVTNVATGLADAVKHRSGLVLLCGDGPTTGPRPIDVDQSAFAAALGAPVIRLDDPATARARVAEAVRLARTGPGPVVLAMPSDLLGAEAGTVPTRPVPTPPTPVLHGDSLEAALDALATARRPLLLAGVGAWRADAGKVLTELGDRLGTLYATTVMANGLFAGSPWSLGVCGGFSSPTAARLIGEADVVLAFGASLNTWTLHGGMLIDPAATVIRVDLPGAPPVDRVDLEVPGDAAVVAAALLAAVDRRGLPTSSWRARAATEVAGAGWRHVAYRDAGTDDRCDPRTLTLAVADLLPDELTLVTDGGHFVGWPVMYWSVPDPAAMVFTGAAFQAIGLGFAGAVGASVGRPDRTTVAVLGDGGALMGLPELETLIRTADSALVVIYDDAAYGAEVHLYAPLGADVRTALFTDTDFAGIARALGARAATVRSPGDLDALREWRDAGCPGTLLLDCKVVREVVATYLADLGAVIRASSSAEG